MTALMVDPWNASVSEIEPAQHPGTQDALQRVFVRRYMTMKIRSQNIDDEISEILAVRPYGYNGRSTRGWAFCRGLEEMLEGEILAHRHRELLQERARRNGEAVSEVEPLEPSEQLFRLRLYRWTLRHFDDQARQIAACEALGIAWPPTGSLRTFLWCWERGAPEKTLPVVYPADWRKGDAIEPDLYDFGDQWVAGEILVIPPDDVPVEAEVVPEPAPKARPATQGERLVDIEVADPELEPPAPDTATDVAVYVPPSEGRLLGRVGFDGFVPDSGRPW